MTLTTADAEIEVGMGIFQGEIQEIEREVTDQERRKRLIEEDENTKGCADLQLTPSWQYTVLRDEVSGN